MNRPEQKPLSDANPLDASAQLKKIAEHLVFLEKKLDMLLENSKSQRPSGGSFGNNSYSRPRGNYGHGPSQGHYNPGTGNRGYGQTQGNRYPSRHSGHSGPPRHASKFSRPA